MVRLAWGLEEIAMRPNVGVVAGDFVDKTFDPLLRSRAAIWAPLGPAISKPEGISRRAMFEETVQSPPEGSLQIRNPFCCTTIVNSRGFVACQITSSAANEKDAEDRCRQTFRKQINNWPAASQFSLAHSIGTQVRSSHDEVTDDRNQRASKDPSETGEGIGSVVCR